MFKRIILSALIMFITTASASAQEKMTIAILDLQPKGTSKIIAGVVTDIIRSEMIKTGLYVVIERNQMAEVLKEQSFQMSGCVEQSCAVQIGKLLSARKVLVGELGMVGKAFMITVRIVDVEKGSSEFAANERAESGEGTTYTEGQTFNMGSGSVKLYANWLDTNTKLSLITVGDGTLSPAFNAGTVSYTVTPFSHDKLTTTISATTAFSAATITINGVSADSGQAVNVNLIPGRTTVSIEVTAADGVSKG